jgi:hypothetical protein
MDTRPYSKNWDVGLSTERYIFQNTRCVLRIRELVASSFGVVTGGPYVTLFIHLLSSSVTVLAGSRKIGQGRFISLYSSLFILTL